MDLIPEKVDGGIVFSTQNTCPGTSGECAVCSEFSVAIHNLMLTSGLRYLVLDLQDEKDVCPRFLEELLQLWKRVRLPFFFTGVMERPKRTLASYAYPTDKSVFNTPEEALGAVKKNHPDLFGIALTGITYGSPIPITRTRGTGRVDDEVEAEAETE